MEYYPYGDEVGAQNFQWENYTINWSPDLQRAVGPNGDLSREAVKGVFNGDTRKVTAEMLMRVHAKIKVIRANWKDKFPPTAGKDRPTLGIDSLRMSRCPCCFDNPAQYNDHMKSIHGIDTDLKRQVPQTPSAPTLQAATNPGFSTDLIVPLLQAIKGNNQKWIAMEHCKKCT